MISMRNSVKYVLSAALLVAVPMMPMQASAETSTGARIGALTCKTVPDSGVSLIIHSTENVTCEFKSTSGGVEHYRGETGVGLGFDMSYDRNTTMVYAVMSADYKAGAHQLTGKYFGAGGSATAGVGAGAQALIGGGKKNVSLQPLAMSGSEGAGLSAGVTYLYLEPDK